MTAANGKPRTVQDKTPFATFVFDNFGTSGGSTPGGSGPGNNGGVTPGEAGNGDDEGE